MPVVDIKVIEGVFTDEEKREMVERVTEALIEIRGEPLRSATHTLVPRPRVADGRSADGR
jgi:4-oxalocrotonate tautomerase